VTRGQAEELERAFQACSAAAVRLFESHSPATLTHRPRPEAWSAAECVVHLSLTAAAFRPLLESALAGLRERERRRAGPSRMDWKGRLLNWSLEPRPWLRMKTTARFQPVSTGPLDGVLPAFLQEQDGIVRTLRSAEGLDLEAGRVTSPFNARLEYNVYTAFRILETHERRHLRQAEAAVSGADGSPPDLP
jgi:hypothetical protein